MIQANISATEAAERMSTALGVAIMFGGIDGEHHKTWVIDQIVRALTGPDYDEVIRVACDGEDGPNTYVWNTGIAP